MITKKYIARYSDYTTFVSVGGNNVKIHFEESYTNGISRFTTSDKRIQEAIESRSDFGTVILLEHVSGSEDKKPVEVIKEVKKSYLDANTVQKAANILVKEFGVQPSKVKTSESVKMFAKMLNVEFPNLN